MLRPGMPEVQQRLTVRAQDRETRTRAEACAAVVGFGGMAHEDRGSDPYPQDFDPLVKHRIMETIPVALSA